MTERRIKKITNVVRNRQKYLALVLENLHDPHNVSAVFRTADAVGIDKIHLVYNLEKFPRISPVSSASAKKWIEVFKYDNVEECFSALKKEKYKIYSTFMDESKENSSLYDLDLTKHIALVFGNEHRGVSEEAKKLSDKNFLIPMKGMVQSLNVSVSVAVSIFEALRQREAKGMYKRTLYKKEELNQKLNYYLEKAKKVK